MASARRSISASMPGIRSILPTPLVFILTRAATTHPRRSAGHSVCGKLDRPAHPGERAAPPVAGLARDAALDAPHHGLVGRAQWKPGMVPLAGWDIHGPADDHGVP